MSETISRNGRGVSIGYAIGSVHIYERNSRRAPKRKITDVDAELVRYENAKEAAVKQLQTVYGKKSEKTASVSAEILMAQSMILQDEEFNSLVRKNIIQENRNAEWAVSETSRYFYEVFNSINDESVNAKTTDLKDVANKLIRLLTGDDSSINISKPSILVSKDINPSELIQMNKDNLLGIIMQEGSNYSHTVILAKAMGIPVVLGVKVAKSWNGNKAIVDGTHGQVYINPDDELMHEYESLINAEEERKRILREMIGKETVTSQGEKISLYANIGDMQGAKRAMANDCEGIGLMRTEFLFLNRETLPTEDEHYNAYKEILKICNGKHVVFRTFDLGADKRFASMPTEPEENPALGMRAIRTSLTNKDMFIAQVKGILRAACHGDVAIMYPMITSVDELNRVSEVISEAKAELEAEGIPYGEISTGIMIETPAAAMISDELAKNVDFFSIGTNDLTQYTLAMDRVNSQLVDFYNPYHEAVMKLIEMTIKNAHKAGIKVALCGELAADINITRRLIDMGIDELSVSSKYILQLREHIRKL